MHSHVLPPPPHRHPFRGGAGFQTVHVSREKFFMKFFGEKRGDSMFCGSLVGGTCRGWSIFS